MAVSFLRSVGIIHEGQREEGKKTASCPKRNRSDGNLDDRAIRGRSSDRGLAIGLKDGEKEARLCCTVAIHDV